MFYSHLVLTKKGPLGNLWLAAQLGESRISKTFASSAKISVLCQSIEQPAAPFALRLSAHLVLGVVRVHARKSAIVLANAHKVMQALHQLAGSEGKRQRPRPASDETATFNEITLPERPRKRSKRLTNSSKFTLSIGRSPNRHEQDGSVDQYGRSMRTMEIDLNIQGVNFGREDVQHLRSRGTPYQAADHEITLGPNDEMQLAALDLGAGIDLDQVAVGSLEAGSDRVPSFDESSPDFAPAFSKRSTPRVSPLSGQSPVLSVLTLPVTGVEVADYQIPLPVDDDAPIVQELPENIPHVVGNAEPVQGVHLDAMGARSGQSKRTSTETTRTKRSRGLLSDALLVTEKTEFTHMEVREWAAGTSSTFYRNLALRPNKRRRREPEKSVEELFFGQNPLGLAPVMDEFWKNVCVKPTLNELGIQPEIPAADADPLQGKQLSQSPSRTHRGVNAQGTPPPQAALPEFEENAFIPFPQDDVPPPPMDELAGNVPIPQLPPAGASVQSSPSKGSGGISVGQSSGSHGPEMLRDKELEVTQEDREEFRRVLQSEGLGPYDGGDALLPVEKPYADDSVQLEPQEAHVQRPSVAGSDDEAQVAAQVLHGTDTRIPIDDDDLRLADTQQVAEPIIRRLNAHSFKMLQMLRKSAAESEAEENERVAGFNEFVQGTSRRACAKAFLNLVGLTSAGYVRVKQEEIYGDIDIFRGIHF